MKKELFIGLAGVVAIAAAVCVTLSANKSSIHSDLLTQNIEAMTQGESSGGCKTESSTRSTRAYCSSRGHDVEISSSITYSCTSGSKKSCKTGTASYTYSCDGSMISSNNSVTSRNC